MSARETEALRTLDSIIASAGPLDGQFNRPDLELVRTVMAEQQAKLAAVQELTQAAWDGQLYVLPGGYPSRPVEAFDLRKALEGKP